MSKKPTTPEELRNKAFAIIEIKHPTLGELVFRIHRQIGTAIALKNGIPVQNPLITLVHDPDRPMDPDDAASAAKKELDNLTPLELMRRIARAAMVEPRYEEVEDIVSNDLFILSAISEQATGLSLLRGFMQQFTSKPEGMEAAPFRKDAEGDTPSEPPAPRVHI